MSLLDKIAGLLPGGKSQGEAVPADDLMGKAQEFVNKKWLELRTAYHVYHLKIWEARLFYAGEMWLDRDLAQGSFWRKAIPNDDFVPQPRINEFAPAIDAICSNFNTVPEVEAVPQPRDDELAMQVAEIANELIDFCIKDNALRSDYKSDEDKAGSAAQEFVLSGNVFTLVYPQDVKVGQRPKMEQGQSYGFQCAECDLYQGGLQAPVEQCPKCGGPVESSDRMEPKQVLDDQGQPVMEEITRKKICVEVGDPGHAFPRPGARNMGETPYLLWGQRFSIDEIRERWGIEVTADNEQPDGFAVTYEQSMAFWYLGYSQRQLESQDGALVVQCFIEPGKMKDWPEGLYAVYVSGKVQIANPWPFVEHPVSKGDYLQMPTIFFARSVSFDLLELQRELNSYESIISLHSKTSAVEPVVIDDNTVVSEITGRADKVIHWRSIGPGSREPHRMQHGSLDEAIYAKRTQILEAMQRISAAVAVFRGEQPGSVTAASAISQLRGQAELQFSKPTSNWNNLWKETIRKVIKNYQQFYTFEQIAAIVGTDKASQIQEFQKADLDKRLTFIATSSGLPKTRDERRQELMVLYDKGALDMNDPNVKEKVFELFGETGLLKTFNDDARRARVNVKKMRVGQPAKFRSGIDDASTHIGICLEAAKSLDFDRWKPEAQQMLIQYIDGVRQAEAISPPALGRPPGIPGAPPAPNMPPVAGNIPPG